MFELAFQKDSEGRLLKYRSCPFLSRPSLITIEDTMDDDGVDISFGIRKRLTLHLTKIK